MRERVSRKEERGGGETEDGRVRKRAASKRKEGEGSRSGSEGRVWSEKNRPFSQSWKRRGRRTRAREGEGMCTACSGARRRRLSAPASNPLRPPPQQAARTTRHGSSFVFPSTTDRPASQLGLGCIRAPVASERLRSGQLSLCYAGRAGGGARAPARPPLPLGDRPPLRARSRPHTRAHVQENSEPLRKRETRTRAHTHARHPSLKKTKQQGRRRRRRLARLWGGVGARTRAACRRDSSSLARRAPLHASSNTRRRRDTDRHARARDTCERGQETRNRGEATKRGGSSSDRKEWWR